MTNETERKKELVGEPWLSYGASGASATSIATRASGAELIRQLSYHKLNHYYQSDETLHQFSGTAAGGKRKSGNNPSATSSSIVKRFSDNQYDYQYQKHRQASTATTAAAATRPRLLRQSTTHSESVAGTSSAAGGHCNRRRLLADTREQRSWRSCDASHQDAPPVATHLLGGSGGVRARHDSVAKSDDMTPFLDLSSSSSSMHRQSVPPKPSPVGSHQGRLDRHQAKADERDDDEQLRKVEQVLDERVRYTKRPAEGADGLDEDCVVLPPLAAIGTRLVAAREDANSELVVLSPEPMLAQAGLHQAPKYEVVLSNDVPFASTANKKKKKVRRSRATADGSKTASVKVAASAIAAVAVVTVGVANKTSFSSSDESNNPRRRARGIVILTSVFLLFTCLFMVGITLRLAPLIDDLGKKRNKN